jgi:hypothetical protein
MGEASRNNAKILTMDHSGLRIWRMQRSLHATDLYKLYISKKRRCIVATTID